LIWKKPETKRLNGFIMKKFNSSILVAVTAVFMLSSCSGLNKMKKNAANIKFDVTPEVVEMHGGNVDVSIDARFPEKYFDKKVVVVATPVLKTADGEVEFKPVTLQGEKVTANNKVINYKAGGKLSYKGVVPYSEAMRLSELQMKMEASKGTKKVAFDPIKLADGVVSTPALLVGMEGQTIVAADNFQRIIPETYKADLHYKINSATVQKNEKVSEDIEDLKKQVKAADEKENHKIRGVKVSAYASPDGELDFNDKLAGNRSATATKFFQSELKKLEVGQADMDEFFDLMSTAEDWEGFKELVNASNIQDKELILRVLSMYNDPDVREKEIRNISAAFTELTEQILPQLRRSQLEVNVDVIGKSDAEISRLAANSPADLNIEELLYAATLTEDVKAQNGIYNAAADKYPKCFRAWNDLGMTFLQMGKVDEGKKAINKAASLNAKSPVVMNNQGVLALIDGDFEKAEGLFRSAAGAGKEVDYNMGIVNVNKGNYSQAVNNFGSACLFNAALAQTLNKNYSQALKTLDCVNEQCVLKDYLKAVVYARQGKADNMYKALEAAVKTKPELKKLAATDVEFGKYFADSKFQSIVK
jgi:tetratricopeptide (TPR) repeat protein